MFTIYIEELRTEAIIGILDFERDTPQPLVADCVITYAKKGEDFVDYAKVSHLIEQMLIRGQYLLLEDALEEIIQVIKEQYTAIKSIKLKLSKPKILANCTVSVEKFTNY